MNKYGRWFIICGLGAPISMVLGVVFPPMFLVAVACLIAVIVILIIALIKVAPKMKAEIRAKNEQYEAELAEKERKQKEWENLCKKFENERKAEKKAERKKRKTPISAVLITTKDERAKGAISTATRGVVGGLLFGPFGAAVGMVSGREKMLSQKAIFSVRYADGHTGTETVEVGSKRFEELSVLLTHGI